MLTCIAIDDEPLALELLEDNISKVPFLKRVASFQNPLEALKLLNEQKIDLVFLDIQMPGITGLQFIQSVSAKPMFILITAYEKYALEGYNLNVVDYLVKPVALDRFIKACNKAWELHQLKSRPASAAQDHIFLNIDYSQVKITLSDILFIEGLKDYIKIQLKSNPRPLISRMSMKNMEEILPPADFIRVHKSFIIGRQHVHSIRKNSIFIDNTEIPVGELYKDSIAAITGKKNT